MTTPPFGPADDEGPDRDRPTNPYGPDTPRQQPMNPYHLPDSSGEGAGTPPGADAGREGFAPPLGTGDPVYGTPAPYGAQPPHGAQPPYGAGPTGTPYDTPPPGQGYGPPGYGPGYGPPGYGPGMSAYSATPRTNGLAIASMVTSLVGLVLCCVPGVVGLVLGIVALGQIQRDGTGGRGFAITGIVVGSVGALAFLGLFVLGGIDAWAT